LRATGVPDHELQKSQEKAVKAIWVCLVHTSH
jgi:hypothetical protein